MHGVMEFLTHHTYAALFAAVLAEQLGLPVPATPFLIAAWERWQASISLASREHWVLLLWHR